MRRVREALMDTPIFRHLTQHFSFLEGEEILAISASHRRLRVARRRRRSAEETEGISDDDGGGRLPVDDGRGMTTTA